MCIDDNRTMCTSNKIHLPNFLAQKNMEEEDEEEVKDDGKINR